MQVKEKNHKKCLLCDSRDSGVIFSYGKPDKYEASVGIGRAGYFRRWVRCKRCGFCYSEYSRQEKIFNKIYISAYSDENASWRNATAEEIFKKNSALPRRESETKFRVDWLKKNISELHKSGIVKKGALPHDALDIGGGAGVFARAFKDKSWRTYIVDPDKNNGFIKTKLHIPLVQDFYKPGLFKKKFTLISLIYVLEHIADPVLLLKNIRKDMNDNSFLYIEIPDSISFRLKPKNDDIFNSCHLWMFDPKTLTALLNSCGFQILRLSRLKTIRGHYCLMVLAGLN